MPWEKGQSGNANGRPKGAVNRKTKHATEFAQSFLRDEDFQDAVRNILCTPNHPHWQWTVETMLNYAYGKPVENKHLTSDGSLPEMQFQLAWMDFRQFVVEQNGDDKDSAPIQIQTTELPS